MRGEYIKAYPKYKQVAFLKIANLVKGMLEETELFNAYMWLYGKPEELYLRYHRNDFSEEIKKATGTIVEGVSVWVGGYCAFTFKGREIHSSYYHKRTHLTEKEYETLYQNLEVLHRFSGDRYATIPMKIGDIQLYTIGFNKLEFLGIYGDSYKDLKDLCKGKQNGGTHEQT